MNTLFDVSNIEISPDYVSPQEKRKWNKAFKKKILDDYDKNDGKYYDGHCGSRKYCELCKMRYCNGSSDCLVALKEYCKLNNIKINYRDFNFDKFLDNFR